MECHKTIKLSICIPSYNRALFLPDLLKSIFTQHREGVEVVICDNGSTDNTQEVATRWQQKYPCIVYERWEQNQGPDRCFLHSIAIAKGEFCWLMGDDDIIEEGALNTLWPLLTSDLSGITVHRMAYDKHLKNRHEEKVGPRKYSRLFTQATPCFLWLFSLFGFLSAQIVRRSAWLAIAEKEDLTPFYNAYVLVYVIGRMIQQKPRWLYVHIPCVGWRSGNDSFAQQLGGYGRLELDARGYSAILRALFALQPLLYHRILHQILSIHIASRIRALKYQKTPIIKAGMPLCFSLFWYSPTFWLWLVPTFLLPAFALRILRYCISSRIFFIEIRKRTQIHLL